MHLYELQNAIAQRSFLPSKPLRDIRPIDIQRNPKIIASRKHNGNYATAIVQNGDVNFFTASNLWLTSLNKSQFWVGGEWANTLQNLPEGTIVLGEIFIPSVALEDLGAFQQWYAWHQGAKVPPPQKATFRAFDSLVMGGQSLSKLPYSVRFDIIPSLLRPEVAPYTSLEEAAEAVNKAKELGIEGYVFWDADAPSKCKLNGRNKARGGAWKVKPLIREKFALLSLVNPQPEMLVVQLGNPAVSFHCGSGLTPDERQEMVRLFKQGTQLLLTVQHYGYDDLNRPETPVMVAFEKA